MTNEAWPDDVGQLNLDTPSSGIDDVVALLRSLSTRSDVTQLELRGTDLSARTKNALHRAGLYVLGDLAEFEDELDLQRSVHGLGTGCLSELRDLVRRTMRGETIERRDESPVGEPIIAEPIVEVLRSRGIDIRQIAIESLGLSPRVERGLSRSGFRTLSQLCGLTDLELQAGVRNFGRVGLSELRSALQGLADTGALLPVVADSNADTPRPTRSEEGASGLDLAKPPTCFRDVGFAQATSAVTQGMSLLPAAAAARLASLLDGLRRFAAWAASEHNRDTLDGAISVAQGVDEMPAELLPVWQVLTTPCGELVKRLEWRGSKTAGSRPQAAPLVDFDLLRTLRRRLVEPCLIPLQDLPLSLRVRNALRGSHFHTLGDLEGLSEIDLTTRVRGMGVLGVREIRDIVAAIARHDVTPPPGAILTLSDGAVLESLRVVLAWAMADCGTLSLIEAIHAGKANEASSLDVTSACEALRGTATRELGQPYLIRYDWRSIARRLLDRLAPLQVSILRSRELALRDKRTLGDLGDEHGVSRERIRQIEAKALKRLVDAIGATDSQPFVRVARRFRAELGEASPAAVALEHLAGTVNESLDRKAVSDELLLFLWHAGPFELLGDWLVTQPAREILDRSRAQLKEALAGGPVSLDTACAALVDVGISAAAATPWLMRCDGVRFVDQQVCDWTGSLGDKAVAILTVRGGPMTRDELTSLIWNDRAETSLQNSLHTDERLIRTGPDQYGLRLWGGDQYTGIVDAIRLEIERQGGEVEMARLVETLVERFGVAESSVRIYSANPQFTRTRRGAIRLADTADRELRLRSIERTKHCFRLRHGWAWRITVTRDTLRGSGRPMPSGIAAHLGLSHGGMVTRPSDSGDVRFSWPPRQGQPNIGSVRPAASALGAEEGDYLFVEFVSDSKIEFHVARRSDLALLRGNARLAAEVGSRLEDWNGDAVRMVAYALGLDHEGGDLLLKARSRIRARDDDGILDLLPITSGVVDEHALADLVDLVTWSAG